MKTVRTPSPSSPSYHYNGFVATHALEHMMCGYTLLVPMKQRVLNISDPRHTECTNLTQARWAKYVCAVMKTMCTLVIAIMVLYYACVTLLVCIAY